MQRDWYLLRLRIKESSSLMRAGDFTAAAIVNWPHPSADSTKFESWLISVTRPPKHYETWEAERGNYYMFYRRKVISRGLNVFIAEIANDLDQCDPLINELSV